MNILHVKYAVEVAKQGSLSRAAEGLLIAQPNLSRAIKELEADLGIVIFSRSPKGMLPTPEGEEFLQYAQGILRQIDEMEMQYKQGRTKKLCFSVSVPQASYVSAAFSEFIHALDETPIEIFYREASLSQTVDNVLNNDYRLGIIRYPVSEDGEYKALLADKGLSYEMVAEFPYVLVMHREHPLAERADISTEDLLPYIEIVQADPAVTAPLLIKGGRSDRSDLPSRRIFALDCGSPLELLSNNSQAFFRSSPLADALLERYGLIQRLCRGMETLYKDVLIYRESYRLTKLDKQFLTALCEEKRRSMRF